MTKPADTQVIAKSYLSGLIIQCSLFFGLGLILTGIILYFSVHHPLGPSYQESFARLSQLKQEMLHKSIIIYSTLLALILAGIVFTTTIYSHRVVGPMIGLKRILGLLGKGDLRSNAVLRDKDAIKPVATSLNCFIDNYKGYLKSINQATKEMRSSLEQAPASAQRQMIARNADEISIIIDKIKL